MKMHFLLLSMALCISACAPAPNELEHKLLDKEAFKCPSGFHAAREPWGEGISVVCKIMDGPFVAVENGYVRMRSERRMGRSIGVSLGYDKDGNVNRKIEYDKDGHTVEVIDYDKDGNAKVLDLSEYFWLKK